MSLKTTSKQTSETANSLTQRIIEYLLRSHCFAFRVNTQGVLDPKSNRFRPAPQTGIPDILAILPPHGRFVGIEVKIAKDKIRPSQEAFIANMTSSGGYCIIAKTFESFLEQWHQLSLENQNHGEGR